MMVKTTIFEIDHAMPVRTRTLTTTMDEAFGLAFALAGRSVSADLASSLTTLSLRRAFFAALSSTVGLTEGLPADSEEGVVVNFRFDAHGTTNKESRGSWRAIR